MGAIACLISSSSTLTSTVFPVESSRPITLAALPVGEGKAEPIAIFSSSADFSPIDTPYVTRMCSWTAASRSKPPTFAERPDTTPPIETTAISERPPPMSTIRLPSGSCTGRFAPTAAASGSSTGTTCRPPAKRIARSIARRSTAEADGGTQTSTLGFGNRVTPTRRSTIASIRCVTSNSVIVPSRSGRTASTLPDSPPSICHASSPIATTSPLPWSATTVGSSKTMPSPCR